MEPFIKCAGGKRQLLPEILSRLPRQIGRYYEPFLGGGAVFFALAAQKRFRKATLSDVNVELVETYRVVADPDTRRELVGTLRSYEWSEGTYYELRDSKPRAPVNCAARFVYLNKCGFNGLHRVNSRGEFNVPFGHHGKSPINEQLFRRIQQAGAALERASLVHGDFRKATARGRGPGAGDVVYCDPPYLPVSKSSFAAYDKSGFGIEETEALAEAALKWSERGAFVLLSNADTPDVRRIFEGFRIEVVSARRSISSKGDGRGPVGEVLIQPHGQEARG